MRPHATLLVVAALCFAAAPLHAQVPVHLGEQQPVQQLPTFKPGDAVDFYTFGKWNPCAVTSPLTAGVYNVRCGSLEFRAKADPRELRSHVVPPPNVQLAFGVETAPAPTGPTALSESVGARYGTRDPRRCNRRPDHFTSADVKDVFICDSEHEFAGSLYLVSNVALEIAPARPFNPAIDARKIAIDHTQSVVDIRATYNSFQCSALPASHWDYPNIRNCNESHTTAAAGACFRNTAGEWHCILADPTSATVATAKNVSAPTTVE
jgi:hypothetical protein